MLDVVCLSGNSMMHWKIFFKQYPWRLWAIIFVAVVVQLILFSYKELLHVDELFSFGTANGDNGVFLRYSAEEYDNQIFRQEDFRNYLLLQHTTFADMWGNLGLDTHMPLYFVFLRLFSLPFAPEFTILPAILLNVLIFIGFLFGIYRLFLTLFKDEEIALGGLMLCAFSCAVLSLSVFMRMYLLWMMFGVYLTDYTIKCLNLGLKKKVLTGVFVFSVLQILTHFYGLIFGFVITTVTCFIFLLGRQYKRMLIFAMVMAASAGVSYLVFPAMIDIGIHGQRGIQMVWRLEELYKTFASVFVAQMPLFIKAMFGHYVIAGICFILFFGTIYVVIRRSFLSPTEARQILWLMMVFIFYGVLSALFQPRMGVWQIRYFAVIIVIGISLIIYMVLFWGRLFKLKFLSVYVILYVLSIFSAIYSAQTENAFWAKGKEVYWNDNFKKLEKISKNADIWWGLGGGWAPVWMMHIVMDKLIGAREVFVLSDIKNPEFVRYAEQERNEGRYAYYLLPYTQEQSPEGAISWIKETTGRHSYFLFTVKDQRYESFLSTAVFLVAPY